MRLRRDSYARRRRTRKYQTKPRRLQDFGFVISSYQADTERWPPLKSFNKITLGTTEQDTEGVFTGFLQNNYGNQYVWIDTSAGTDEKFIRMFGEREGETHEIKYVSFIHACTIGLTSIDDKYHGMLREVKRAQQGVQRHLEEIIRHGNSSFPMEIIEEHASGKGFLYGGDGQVRNPKYFMTIQEKIRAKERLIGMMGKNNQQDKVLPQLQQTVLHDGLLDACTRVAEEYNVGTSRTDNLLVAYAFANAARVPGQLQKLLTADRGIVCLADKIGEINRNKARVRIRENIPTGIFCVEMTT